MFILMNLYIPPSISNNKGMSSKQQKVVVNTSKDHLMLVNLQLFMYKTSYIYAKFNPHTKL